MSRLPAWAEEITVADPGPGQVKVQVEACAICHSDIHFIDGAWGGRLPAVYGHEAAGTVSAIGEGVANVAIGDRVVISLIRSCGSCPGCAKGMPVTCTGRFTIDETRPLTDAGGESLVHGLKTGTFAEEAVVDSSQVVAVPESIPVTSAALLGCLFAALATVWLARLFRRQIGGYTGDCLGATQQLAEVAFYGGLLCNFS